MTLNSSAILTKGADIPNIDRVIVARSATSTTLNPRDTRPSKSPTEERVPLTPPPAPYEALDGGLRMDEEAHESDSCRLRGKWPCLIVKIQTERTGSVLWEVKMNYIMLANSNTLCDTHRRNPPCQFSRRRKFLRYRITSLTVPF
jgi:hypothetical protein